MNPKTLQRFWKKVKKTNNCWIWQGDKTKRGYGRFRVDGKMVLSHRVSYELFNEYIPYGLEIDHLCRNHSCVNPEHLEAVTHKENCKRGLVGRSPNSSAFNRNKTHCPKGHEYTIENIYQHKNMRHCKECMRIRNKKLIAKGKNVTSNEM